MTDTVTSLLGTVPGRLTKGMRIAAVSFAVVVLMALSFTLGRATIDRAARVTPAVQPAVQPVVPPTILPELGCPYPGRC